ncbi:unnamed protein product, partial [Rotaria sp. Silwood1]
LASMIQYGTNQH